MACELFYASVAGKRFAREQLLTLRFPIAGVGGSSEMKSAISACSRWHP